MQQLQKQLIAATIGGSSGAVDQPKQAAVFAKYVRLAFPGAAVRRVIPVSTVAALNSISGMVRLEFPDGTVRDFFGKVHIESNTHSINPLGAEKEYINAQLLADAGWPALAPIAKSDVPDYPLLLYPLVREPALFDKLETSHKEGLSAVTAEDIQHLETYNKLVGKKGVETLRKGNREEAVDAPVQTLFLKRFERGGRIDQWYTNKTTFRLPGIDQPVSWNKLLDAQWIINGERYDTTIRDIVDQSRQSLVFAREREAFLIISHGDDHAGNVRLTDPVTVFDPAFAGWNPASLELKALAHTGFLPMGAMYYSPKGLAFRYARTGNTISIEHTMQNLPVSATHEMLARQIIDYRLVPLMQALNRQGGNMKKEIQRIRNGLAGCALLTVNVAKLLQEGDGRGIGLLPMAIMFQELRGLPMLEYLRRKLS